MVLPLIIRQEPKVQERILVVVVLMVVLVVVVDLVVEMVVLDTKVVVPQE